ncbi:S-methyl-5-thioribose-1-phosphate isomerase [Pokkaliibacter sp. CJK22405]|uniref:S-methyl-5-thioribose-1-phosphate isomerase n=1 Tax=Pokkaliibacter sp. CJK22405 TaxID=3384615 RepID=UPI003984FC9F
MKNLLATAIKYEQGRLWILDQHALPHEENWLACDSVDDMIAMIKALKIRGAPLIGVGAALLLAHLAEQGADREQLENSALALREARPTAVNLMHCMDRMLASLRQNDRVAFVRTAEALFEEDIALCDRIAANGAELFSANVRLLTHCNTGRLATAGKGTALGVVYALQEAGKTPFVWVDETRPLLQGGRLTTWELDKYGISHRLQCDNMAGILLRDGQVDAVVVGADRIARNGDFANKVGTYSLAVLARHHNVPFYVVAPYTTVDLDCADGSAIPIEQRAAEEVVGVSGSFGEARWAPNDVEVFNPAFDVTPAELVSGWIMDTGVYSASDIAADALAAPRS